jgi:hypothetical protein
MPSLHRYALSALLLALPLVAAQGHPGAQGGAQSSPGDEAQGQADSNQPPAGAPEGASGNQGDESMPEYPLWYSNDYNCGAYTSPSITKADPG